MAVPVRLVGDVEDVDEAAAGVADGRDDALERSLAVVFEDDAGGRREVGADVGIHAAGIGHRHRDAVVHQAPSHRAALDEELDLEGARQHPVERADDELVLTDGERAHNLSL